MELPGGRDSRFNLGYSMNLLSGETPPEIYGNPNLGRPSTSLQQLSPRHAMGSSGCGGRGHNKSEVCYDERGMSSQGIGLDCGVNDMSEDPYNSMQSKKSPPSNGKKTKGRVKIKMEYIENKLRRYTTFSKRKTGIMKKAYELSTLTGTQVMLLVASETGHVYTFATRKLQPMITSEAGKALIQTCLNSPDPPVGASGGDQRMSATGFEETELTYNISDEDSKGDYCDSASSSDEDDLEMPDEISEKIEITPDTLFLSSKTEKALYSDRSSTPPSQTVCTSNYNPSAEATNSFKRTNNKTTYIADTSLKQIVPTDHCLSNKTVESGTNLGALITNSQTESSQTLNVNSKSESGLNIKSLQTGCTDDNSQMKALPLLVQTPTGIGYATLPDGHILGMLQGVSQPQLIALPLSSILSSSVTTIPNSNITSNNESSNETILKSETKTK